MEMVSRLGKSFRHHGMCYLLMALSCVPLHAQTQGTVTYVYTDPQGTPLAEADVHGNMTATYDYTPYGSQAMGAPPLMPA